MFSSVLLIIQDIIQQNTQLAISDLPDYLMLPIEYSIALLNPTNITAKLFTDFLQSRENTKWLTSKCFF